MAHSTNKRLLVLLLSLLTFLHNLPHAQCFSQHNSLSKRQSLRHESSSHAIGHKCDRTPVLKNPHEEPRFSPTNAQKSVMALSLASLLFVLPALAVDHPMDYLHLNIPNPIPDADPRYFLSGGLCAAASHGVTTPIDVVKTSTNLRSRSSRRS
jgi:hypothetical protein